MLERIDFWLVVITLGFLAWLESRSLRQWVARWFQSVKTSSDPAPVIMSNEAPIDPSSFPSFLETDGRRTETTAPGPKFTEQQLLTLYALLRDHKIPRDKASQALKAAGIPMNNNLWAKAAPPSPGVPVEDDDAIVTPIAGRRTRASFYPDDPELDFSPPPR